MTHCKGHSRIPITSCFKTILVAQKCVILHNNTYQMLIYVLNYCAGQDRWVGSGGEGGELCYKVPTHLTKKLYKRRYK